MPRIDLIKVRGGTLSAWEVANPILAEFEPGLVSDYRYVIYGDGTKDFITLWGERDITGGGGSSKFFESEADLLAALPPDDEDRYNGEWALVQGVSLVTVWTWSSVTSEWSDTAIPVNFVVDQEFDPSSTNAIANKKVVEEFAKYLKTDGTISIEQVTDLTNQLLTKLEAGDIYNIISPMLQQGFGISIQKTGTLFRFVNTNPETGVAANWGSIGGVITEQSDLATEFAKYLKKYAWKTTNLVGNVRTFDFDNVQNPVFRIEPTEDEEWVFINVPSGLTEFVSPFIRIKYSGISSFTATLPAGTHLEDGTDNDISEIIFPTGKASGYVTAAWGYRTPENEYTWSFGEGGSGSGATSLDELTDVNAPSPADGDVLTWDDSAGEWVSAAPTGGGGGGATNLTSTPSPTTVVIASDTGTDATLVAADVTNAGLLLPAEKTKIANAVLKKVFTPLTFANPLNVALNDENLKFRTVATGNFTIELGTVTDGDGSNTILQVNTGAVATAIVVTFDASYTHKSVNATALTYTLPAGAGKDYDVIFISKVGYIEVAVVDNSTGAAITYASSAEINTGTEAAKSIAPDQLEASKYLTQSGSKLSATASGTDTYTATISPAITAYANTQRFFIKFTNANTGAATINLNSLGAKSIVKSGGTALTSGDIAAGQIHCLAYDGTNFQIVGGTGSGGGGGSGTVTSVAMTVPTGFSVSGSPIINSGTFAVTENTQSANKIKAGPSSGSAATPSYRDMVTDDLPSIGSYSWLGNNTPSSAKPTPTPGVSRQQLMSEYQYAKEFLVTSTLDKTAVLWIFKGTSNVDLNLQLLSNTAYSNIHWIIYNASPNSSTITLQRAGSDQLYDGVTGLVNSKAITVGQCFNVNHGISNWMIRL
jgi:hypothetical protein